jgi:taurine dioxygenase
VGRRDELRCPRRRRNLSCQQNQEERAIAVRSERLATSMASAISGLDLNAPLDQATRTMLRAALHDSLVLCIRDQHLRPVAFRDAMTIFGTPVVRMQLAQHPDCREVNIISSEDRDEFGDGKRLVNGAHWHTDDSFMREPCSLTMLYGLEVPSAGGDTQFTNMYLAYADLPADLKRVIDGLKVVHKYNSSRKGTRVAKLSAAAMAAMPDAVHPLVRTHPETGRRALYLNPNRMEQVVGLERKESDALLDELTAHATGQKYQYRHRWRRGDVVIWDNRCTMHKANADYPDAERRLMHRIVVAGSVPV